MPSQVIFSIWHNPPVAVWRRLFLFKRLTIADFLNHFLSTLLDKLSQVAHITLIKGWHSRWVSASDTFNCITEERKA